jgi:HEXXH motif-containing protein
LPRFDPSFFPDCARALRMDRHMRCSLADSLDYLLDETARDLPFARRDLAPVLTGLRDGEPYPPSTFGLYAELVAALLAGDAAAAERNLRALVDETPLSRRGMLTALAGGSDGKRAALYQKLMSADSPVAVCFSSDNGDAANRFRARYDAAMALLAAGFPELAAEIRALVTQIIMVAGDRTSKSTFDGGSCYMLWGGMFINVDRPRSTLELAEVIAHESAHMLLYAMACDEALVYNPDDERHASPLRTDERPMDGIYHATYVSARMHLAMASLLESGVLGSAEAHAATAAMEADASNFRAGYGVVSAHGRLTETGEAVMAAAAAYMGRH